MQQPTYECSEHIFACNPTLPHINYITIGKSLVKGSKKKKHKFSQKRAAKPRLVSVIVLKVAKNDKNYTKYTHTWQCKAKA